MIESLKRNESIQYQKLTPEEMKSRGILGRLIGPCADFNNPTRNGRKYSEKLWEHVFNDPIMQEKIKNGVCFGELGHPADRTEIDMEKIAVCLREQPKKNNKGQLCACFDILDTPNGRILKTLCDYGSTVGVSSRGTGDIINGVEGDEVDPETYECECWDVVLVPAVETARMQYIKEGLDKKNNMKKALCESLEKASEEDKKVMKETLKNLNIKLDEDKEEIKEIEEPDTSELAMSDEEVKDIEEPFAETDAEFDEVPEDGKPVEVETEEKVDAETVGELANQLNDLDPEAPLEFKPVEEPGEVKGIEFESEDGKVVAEIKTEENDEEKSEEDVEIEVAEPEEGSNDDENVVDDNIEDEDEGKKDEVEEALDNGSKELIKNLQESLKCKMNLEAEVKSLQEKLAVSDTKVDTLNEELNNYKATSSRLSGLAHSAKSLKEQVSKLEESLKSKDKLIEEQKSRILRLIKNKKDMISKSESLSESITNKDKECKSLNENLSVNKTKYESEIKSLNERLESVKTKAVTRVNALTESLNKANNIKESYKNLANKTISKYIECKALMLGVSTQEIKGRLAESYTLEDIDSICEDLKAYRINVSKLPFNIDSKVRIKVNESVNNKLREAQSSKYDDDEVDDSLLKLAGR